MKKSLILVFTFSLVALLFMGFAGCSSDASPSSTTPAGEFDEIRSFADPATETALQGLSENDLSKYTRYANAEFKAALTQEIFDQTAASIKSQLGAFKSVKFLSTEEQDGYIIVHYKASYEKGEVGVRMVFDKDHLIAGQWFE